MEDRRRPALWACAMFAGIVVTIAVMSVVSYRRHEAGRPPSDESWLHALDVNASSDPPLRLDPLLCEDFRRSLRGESPILGGRLPSDDIVQRVVDELCADEEGAPGWRPFP